MGPEAMDVDVVFPQRFGEMFVSESFQLLLRASKQKRLTHSKEPVWQKPCTATFALKWIKLHMNFSLCYITCRRAAKVFKDKPKPGVVSIMQTQMQQTNTFPKGEYIVDLLVTLDPFPFFWRVEGYKDVKGFPLIWALYKHASHIAFAWYDDCYAAS